MRFQTELTRITSRVILPIAWQSTNTMGIRNCRHKGLEELYVRGRTKYIGARYHANILRILDHLAAIADLRDCEGVKDFHELKGDRQGTFSMHVSGNYCITFKWNGHDVFDLDFEDYH